MVGEPEDLDVRGLEFDSDNIAHLARHGVSQSQVEEAFRNAPRFFRNLTGRGGTHAMIGPDSDGRFLYVSLAQTQAVAVWPPITGWRLGRRGRRLYEQR